MENDTIYFRNVKIATADEVIKYIEKAVKK